MEQIRIAVLTPYDKVLAFLDNTVPSAMHYFDETLHTYLKGSAYTFEFTTLTAHDDAVFLVEGNRLSFTRKNKGYYLTIMNVEKGGDTTTVTAYGLCLELTNEYVDAYKAPRAMSFAEYVNAYGFEKSFVIGKNEVSDKRITHEWTGSDTVLARLYSIANVFDAELEFVTQLNDDYSLKNFVLNIYRAHSDSIQGMGSDKRSTILRYPNDVYGIIKTSDITELYTAIRPTGTNGLQLNSISGRVVNDSNGNVLYKVNGNNILAPQARDRFPSTLLTNNSNDMYAVQIWSYETENVETLYGQALAQLKKNCVPKVTYDVDAYIDADIGDTFTIEDAEYSPTLYLEARITEQEICFTDSEKCKTIFDNFEEKQSQISSALISEMNKMIELKKVYEGSIVSSNGVLFKEDSDSTKLTALVKDDGVDITSKYSIIWYKDDERLSTSQTITVNASDFTEKAVYRFKAMSGDLLKASAEVTVMRLQDGQNGTSAYVHIAYANSSDGRVDFSLTDSNRKFIGQYSDSKQYGSEDPTKYRWSVIKGEDGQSFISAEEQFYYSTSQTELVGGEWFVGNVVYQSDKFLWKRWKCTYANPSEIKYTKAIFDNTWNEIDSKIGEIHTQVSQANNQSKEAVDKATQAQTAASKANELANTANTQSSEAKQLAQDANTSTGKAQQQIDAIKGDITDSKQQIQDAVDKANANASEIATVKETYATKVDLTNESKTIHADVSTEIEKKVGELSTTVSQTYASKSDLTSIEGSLNTKIKQNADSITTQASSIEKLQSDTTQAQLDIADATKKATQAQATANQAVTNAQSAQTLADEAKQKADSAQLNLDNANKELADAKANLETVTGRVDATESEITKAQTRLTNAETAVQKAQSDATKAQGNATTAINNAKAAQGAADDAKQKAEQAKKDLADLTNKVTSNTTKIEQNSNAIKLQAKSVTEIKGVADNANSNASSALNKANSLTDRANSGEFDGRGVASTKVEYQASTSGTTVPTGAWSSTPPKTTADKPYLWTRTVITYSDNTQSTSYSVGSTPEGIQVGGRNLVLNSDFTKGIKHWVAETGTLEIGSDTIYGQYLIINPNKGSRAYYNTKNVWRVNQIYSYSFLAKASVDGVTIHPSRSLVDTSETKHFLTTEWKRYEGNINCTLTADTGTLSISVNHSETTNPKIYITKIKLELGNKATDWTPAPEDVDEAINTERTERQSAIETKANEITSKVSETYVSNSTFEHYQNTVSTQFTQTKKDFTWSINQSVTDAKNEMSGQIDSVNGRLDGLKQTTDNVNSYMSFDNDALTLGKSDSAFKTKITNQEWSIQKNGAKVTYINDQTMYITDGQFTQSLKIGAFGFVPRTNGSLDFKKVG
jgi:predicted  nucleic acid-binding Zn-ribbon protein